MDRKSASISGVRYRWVRVVVTVLVVLLGSVAGTPSASAQDFINKAFSIDPGGTAMEGSAPYFVGQMWPNTNQWQAAVWSWNGSPNIYPPVMKWSSPTMNGMGMMDYLSGSAVYFDGYIYVFAPYYSTPPGYSGSWISVEVFVIDPSDWTTHTSYSQVLDATDVDIPGSIAKGMGVPKIGVAAAVANGAIYLFTTSATNSPPEVLTSADGQNWAIVGSPAGSPDYPTVHDAITFIDPTDGKTKIMVVLSQVDSPSSAYRPLLPAVSVFDPVTNTWGPASPLPQGALTGTCWGLYGNAWFGSFTNFRIGADGNEWWWYSDHTDAYLHVLGVVLNGTGEWVVHWYLDPSTMMWRMDQGGTPWSEGPSWLPPAPQGIVPWPTPPCWAGGNFHSPAVLGVAYGSYAEGTCTSTDGCIQQSIYVAGCLNDGYNQGGWWMEGYANMLGVSDIWVPSTVWQGKGTAQPGPWTYNTVDTSNPGDPAFGNSPAVYQSMADTIRINGIVMGPPPFPVDPTWQGPDAWAETSNVQLGQSTGTTSGTTSTFNSSITAGVTGTLSAPFVQGKEGLSFEYGYASTHSTENSFTSAYTWTMGTVDQTLDTLGKQGWMVGHAPIIWPESYLATSARDSGPTGTYMGYSQMLLNVGDALSTFWPYSLTNPSDTSYPMGFLLTGVKPLPASTDVQGWNINQGGAMQDWSDTSSGNWSVVGGKAGSGAFTIDPLSMGTLQTQQFVKSTTTGKSWSDSYSGESSTSLRIGTKGNNVETSLDLSFGYETEGSSSTMFEQNMETSYLVPMFQGGYSEVYVQPYLLQATTYNAPWVPKGYKGPLPWAVTWDVTYAAMNASTLGRPETVYSRTTMPEKAHGRITGTAEPNDPKAKARSLVVTRVRDDRYGIEKGRLSYLGPDESLIPVAMTADDFDPSRGITITLNGYRLYATRAKGTWKRPGVAGKPGKVWTYASRYGTERLCVTLDFGTMTWNMEVSRIELGDRFAGVGDTATVTLDLNSRYVLSTRIVHGLAYEWETDLSSFTQSMEMHTINVKQDTSGAGKVRVTGRLTDRVRTIGDVSLVLNEARKEYNLMNTPEFMEKVKEKRPIRYRDASGTLDADLETGCWTMTADTTAFPNPRPMHHGDVELKVKIGGRDYFSAYVHPDNYVLVLSYELPQ